MEIRRMCNNLEDEYFETNRQIKRVRLTRTQKTVVKSTIKIALTTSINLDEWETVVTLKTYLVVAFVMNNTQHSKLCTGA